MQPWEPVALQAALEVLDKPCAIWHVGRTVRLPVYADSSRLVWWCLGGTQGRHVAVPYVFGSDTWAMPVDGLMAAALCSVPHDLPVRFALAWKFVCRHSSVGVVWDGPTSCCWDATVASKTDGTWAPRGGRGSDSTLVRWLCTTQTSLFGVLQLCVASGCWCTLNTLTSCSGHVCSVRLNSA